jgi:hypothetical protein
VASIEIHSVQTVSGNQARVRRIVEDDLQTFLQGVPVQLDVVDSTIQEWDGVTILQGIAGFSLSYASNLVTAGVPKTLTFGTVPNETSAVNIPRGAPLNDGRIDFEVASDDTVFRGQVGPAQTLTQANVGKQYGLTKDTDGHWYVDLTKLTVGTNTVVTIVKLDPTDQGGFPLATPPATPRGVYFQINQVNAQQIGA